MIYIILPQIKSLQLYDLTDDLLKLITLIK